MSLADLFQDHILFDILKNIHEQTQKSSGKTDELNY